MLVFQKQPDGTFRRTGAELPTETQLQILIDANAKPMKGMYTYPEAIKLVEDAIAKGTEHYRFELVGASANHKARSGARPKAKVRKTQHRPASPKKETGHARRLRLIRTGLCTACGKRKPRKGRRECKTCADYYANWAKAKAKKAARSAR